MEHQYVNMETLLYTIFEVHNLEELVEYKQHEDHDRESFEFFLNAIKDFCDKDCYPFFKEMDEKHVVFENGEIIVHPQVKVLMDKSGELGLIGSSFSYEDGGVQLPSMMYTAAYFILDAANNSMGGYPGLTSGAANLIVSFGSKELKDLYVPKMIEGKWGGTMCLTEPQAGSSLSDITTTAYRTEDGHFKIEGQKIWISGGDWNYAENIVHLVLARIEGAPKGTRGISLFVVPKNRITDSGGFENNDVITAGDFQKLGQRGYSTAHLVFGEEKDCRGWLIGEENKGLKCMFQMMNGARISVGRHGAAIAMAAYYASLQYANERPQGRRLSSDGTKNLDQSQTPIINHPDVRRMMLFQKAISEGSLSLIMQAAYYHDKSKVCHTEQETEKYHLLTELLTPIVKTYPSEKGLVSVSTGLQVLGGMGFSREHTLQQYYRDIRIMSIYEGTTGIQSLDLLGRKVTFHEGKALKYLEEELEVTFEEASAFEELKPYISTFKEKYSINKEILAFLQPFAAKGNFERYLADATLYMEFFGTLIVAWQWLKIATKAQKDINSGNKSRSIEFYQSKIQTMKFFFKYELPIVDSLKESITSQDMMTIVDENLPII